jgi:iron(III) transport system substrate-binding protein
MRLKYSGWRGLGAAALILLGPASADAQDWKAEWARTVEAANKEGEVIMQSQPFQTAREFLLREWPKAYPNIKLSLSALPEPQFVARIRTERQADKYLWDVSVAGAQTGYNLSKEGIVDPLMPEMLDPDVKRPELWGGWDEAFMDKEKKYVFSITSFIASPYYNATKVPPEQVAREGLKTMLDPKYAGKITWLEPTLPGGGRTLAQLLHYQLKEEGLRKLLLDQKTVIVGQQHQVVEAMARGTAWIGILPSVRGLMGPYLDAGVKADELRTFGNTAETGVQSVSGANLYVYNKRPHPNAARVFVNWLLTKEVQHGFAVATAQASRRRDVPHAGDPEAKPIPGVKYITPQREENVEPQNETLKLIAEIKKAR